MRFLGVGTVVPCSLYFFAQMFIGALPARAQTCPVQDIALNTTVSSNLSETSCGYQDLVPDSTLSLNVQPFSLTVTSQGILTLDMGGSFDTNVYLLDRNFYRFEPDLENSASLKPGNNSQLTLSLKAGTYLILATSASPDQFGDFTLKAGWTAPPNCAIEDLPTPAVVNSNLTPTDCRLLDIVAPSTDTERVKRYRVTTSSLGALDLKVSSSAFVTDLEVRDKNNVEISIAVSDFELLETGMTVSLKPDTYLVYVSSNDQNFGAFSLSSAFGALRNCSPDLLSLDPVFPQQGNLDPAKGCRYLDLVVPSADVSLVTPYSLMVDDPKRVQIDLQSTAFDSYIEVLDANGKDLDADVSNGSNDKYAELATSLNPGKYTVLASTANYGSGAYTIRASSTDLRPCPGTDAGTQISGSLGHDNDCRVMDVLIPSSDITPVGRYNVTLSQESALRLQASATGGLLPALNVYDGKMQFVNGAKSNQSSEYALLNTLLLPGDYTVLVSLTGGNAGGYTLNTTVQQPRGDCPIAVLPTHVAVGGTFSKTDCIASDVLVGSASNASAKQYSFNVPTAGLLTLSASSGDTTVFVKLVNALDEVVASAVAHSTPGQIQVALPAGGFKVLVLPWAGTTGSFQLQADFRRAAPSPFDKPIRSPGPIRNPRSGRRYNGR